jgi:hypothetical protein
VPFQKLWRYELQYRLFLIRLAVLLSADHREVLQVAARIDGSEGDKNAARCHLPSSVPPLAFFSSQHHITDIA